MIDGLSKRAPSIVVLTLCASLLGEWMEAPGWLITAIAIAVGALALLLFAARGRGPRRSAEDSGATQSKNWIAYELEGKGTPPGSYLLCFFGFLTVVLIGFQSPYARPAWAGVALGVVWGIANREYPPDDEEEP
jgi:hypothetical protein